MASGGVKWREDQILIICPGSQTTLAQLGCSELTLPTQRIPTRMFKDGDHWRPYHTFQRTRIVGGEEVEEWVEDIDEDQGAVWPLKGGAIIHMGAFLAFLDHVHSLLTTTYHNTPIMLMASPQWTRPDCESIARYIFEKTRTPALCLIHSGIATQYGLKWPHMTVVDIGFEKVDVTAIHDGRVVNHADLGNPISSQQISGGEVFTRRLMEQLKHQDFTHDMAEQLKKSTICEVLPYSAAEDSLMELPKETTANPAAINLPQASEPSVEMPDVTEPVKAATNGHENTEDAEAQPDEDGVLDVAGIVNSGQTKEFLAKKEKEKQKPGRRNPRDGELGTNKPTRLPNNKRTHNTFAYEEIIQEEVTPEPKPTAMDPPIQELFKEPVQEAPLVASSEPSQPVTTEHKQTAETKIEVEVPLVENSENTDLTAESGALPTPQEAAAATTNGEEGVKSSVTESNTAALSEEKPTATVLEEPKPAESGTGVTSGLQDTPERRPKRIRRDIEVGLERFTFADRTEIDRIVSTIYRAVQGVDDMYMRPACWENLVFVGNGSRLRGLKENILQTLNARHLVSPSTATMFTSELPSNMATPSGTGAQTPTGSYSGAPPHQLSSSGVNPLLQAATTSSSLGVAAAATPQAGSEAGAAVAHHFHSQTPTSIKTITFPSYMSEWNKSGFEEAMFLGAQVAARIVFCLHSNMDAQTIEAQRLASLSRVDYNEFGPKAIRTHSMLSYRRGFCICRQR